MPYPTVEDLPPPVRKLPSHGREIFRAAFNAAWQSYADRGPEAQEEIAHRVAWAAVKKRYRRVGKFWMEKQGRRRARRVVPSLDETSP